MNKTYDDGAHAGYLRFSRLPIVSTKPLSSRVMCDMDEHGFPVGIEFLELSQEQFLHMTESLELAQK